MAYIGKSPSQGVRSRFQYQATAGQSSFSSTDANGLTLTYTDSLYMDVYQNGILLVPGDDYTATTGTTVVLVQSASLDDIIEMVVYDVFSVPDAVSQSAGGTFSGNVTMGGTLAVTGNVISPITLGGTTPTLTIGDAGAEDAKIVFDGNAQDYHIGLDDSADSLIIGKGSALGTTTSMAFDANGIITKPLQPAFQARPSSNQDNIATDTQTTIALGTEVFDVNGDFASNTFTAPVTGKYALKVQVRLDNLDSAANYYRIDIVTSNRSYYYLFDPDFGQDQSYWTVTNSVVADMDANDTASIKFLQDGNGAVQTDIFGSADGYTLFSGYLVA